MKSRKLINIIFVILIIILIIFSFQNKEKEKLDTETNNIISNNFISVINKTNKIIIKKIYEDTILKVIDDKEEINNIISTFNNAEMVIGIETSEANVFIFEMYDQDDYLLTLIEVTHLTGKFQPKGDRNRYFFNNYEIIEALNLNIS